MTIIVFLIDNTASMNQRCSSGQTFLDLAKGAVETFLKFRSRDPSARGVDRYMLLTFEETPKNIKAGWRESHVTLMQELKNLKATGSCTIGQALGNSLHFLNVNRLQSCVDNFGFGRYPSFLEPVVLLLITDGCHLKSDNAELANELDIARSTLPGSELYVEPYRWDQRIFGIVLRIPGQNAKISPSNAFTNDIPQFEAVCEATGGRSFCITSQKMLNQCMENLVQRVQTGVVVVFEKVGPDPPELDGKQGGKSSEVNSVNAEHKLRHLVENGFVQQNESCAATQPLLLDASAEIHTKNVPKNHVMTKNRTIDSNSIDKFDLNQRDVIKHSIDGPSKAGHDVIRPAPATNCVSKTNASADGVKIEADESKTDCSSLKNGSGEFGQSAIDDINRAWHWNRTMLCVPRTAGRGCAPSHWPLPEPFYPDPTSNTLPSRNAQAVLKFKCEPCEPLTLNDLPYDKYEVELCPLTQFILERKQPSICWQVFVANSSRNSDLGQPFGYLKPATGLSCVNLFVLPYNYPVLLQLLDELRNVLNSRPTSMWRSKFEKYFRSIPPYYLGPLKKNLARCQYNVQPEIPVSGFLSYNVLSSLGKMKPKGKEEFDRLCQTVISNQNLVAKQNLLLCSHSGLKIISKLVNPTKTNSIGIAETSGLLSSEAELRDKDPLLFTNEFPNFRIHIALKSAVTSSFSVARNENFDPAGNSSISQPFELLDAHLLHQKSALQLFLNPFDIPRCKLLQQIQKMRVNLAQHLNSASLPILEGGLPGSKLKLQDAEELHRLPVGRMGNYQDYLKVLPASLKPLETQPIRQHAFGNPFKVDKRMLVDEADLDIGVPAPSSPAMNSSLGGASTSGPSKLLRKSLSETNLYNASSQSGPGRPSGQKPSARPQKRKAGPLPKDFSYKKFRLSDDSSSLGSCSPDYAESLPEIHLDLNNFASGAYSHALDRVTDLESDFVSISQGVSNGEIIPLEIKENKIVEDGERAISSRSTPTHATHHVKNTAATGRPPRQQRPKSLKSKPAEAPFRPEKLFDLKRDLALLIKKPRYDLKAITDLINFAPSTAKFYLLNYARAEAIRFKRNFLAEQIAALMTSSKKPRSKSKIVGR